MAAPRKTGQARKSGPQEHQDRVEGTEARPRKRTPVSGQRDILTVMGKNPEFEYRWVSDKDDAGARIFVFKEAGYEFVQMEEVSGIGENNVYTTDNVGSIVARPDGSGRYLFLMKIRKEWYDEDQVAKANQIDETELSIKRKRAASADDGQYGEVKLTRTPIGNQ